MTMCVSELENYNRQLKEQDELIHRLKQDIARLRLETIHDASTSLYSTAFFYARLREELFRSERCRHFLSVIIIDIELQAKNSTQQADQFMRQFREIAASGINRRIDVIALYARRQMAIILPETDLEGAEALIDRYKQCLPGMEPYLRFAVVGYPQEASNVELFVARMAELADELQAVRHAGQTQSRRAAAEARRSTAA